jgi:hypothetical protein
MASQLTTMINVKFVDHNTLPQALVKFKTNTLSWMYVFSDIKKEIMTVCKYIKNVTYHEV